MTQLNSSKFPTGFKGLYIPLEIWELDLPLPQTVLLAEIRALADLQKEKGCFASNAHFSALLGVNDRTVRKHITALEDAGHLRAEGRGGKKRRMWMERPDAAGPAAPADQNETRQNEAEAVSDAEQAVSNSRHSYAADPGSSCASPANPDRPTRREGATEESRREQLEKPKETTTKNFGEFSIPSWLDPLDWQNWLDYNRELRRTLSQSQMKAQIESLKRLWDEEHHLPADVIRHAIESGYRSFSPLPPSKRSKLTQLPDGRRIVGGYVAR